MRRLVLAVALFAVVLGSAPASAAPTKFDEYSLNWAGYYVPKPADRFITQVSATMVTPKPNALVPTESGSWVGVGGANTDDLIQAGVAFGRNGYYAWYELLPAHVTPINGCRNDATCRVQAGDRIDVDIRFLGGDAWQVYLTNIGKWSWYRTLNYKSSFSSAEWIYEAPSTSFFGVLNLLGVPAAHAPAVFLHPRFAVNGFEQSPRPAETVRTHVSPLGGVNVSTTSAMSGSGAFAVCPYRQSCPTP